jgi:hypothetical protein
MIWEGHEALVKNINTYKNMVEKTEGEVPLGKCAHKRENNFKIGIKKIRLESLDMLHTSIFRDTVQGDNCLKHGRLYLHEKFCLLRYSAVYSGES